MQIKEKIMLQKLNKLKYSFENWQIQKSVVDITVENMICLFFETWKLIGNNICV